MRARIAVSSASRAPRRFAMVSRALSEDEAAVFTRTWRPATSRSLAASFSSSAATWACAASAASTRAASTAASLRWVASRARSSFTASLSEAAATLTRSVRVATWFSLAERTARSVTRSFRCRATSPRNAPASAALVAAADRASSSSPWRRRSAWPWRSISAERSTNSRALRSRSSRSFLTWVSALST